jgi:hypothetical protein
MTDPIESRVSADAAAAMAAHGQSGHGRADFDVARDVHVAGTDAPWQETLFTFDPKGRWYTCRDPACVHKRFYLDVDPPQDPVVRILRRSDPALEPFLAGLKTTAARDARVNEIDSGQLGEQLAALLAKGDQQRTRHPNPAAAARKQGCQAFLLAHYQQHGNVQEALDALTYLRRDDREQYQQVTGGDRLYAPETFRGYWRDIPLTLRAAAKKGYLEHREFTP